MTKATFQIPEVCGKTVRYFSVNDDQAYGREVNVKFTDGTEVSLWITLRQDTSVQCIETETGKVLFEREDQEAPMPEITL